MKPRNPDMTDEEQLCALNWAMHCYEIAIPGLCLACILGVISFITSDGLMGVAGLVIGGVAALVGQVGKFIKRRVILEEE